MSPKKRATSKSPTKKPKSPSCGVKKSPLNQSIQRQSCSTPSDFKNKSESPAINFDEYDDMLDKSWAKIVEEAEEMNNSIASRVASEHRRKASSPKKSDAKPKFVRSLELTEALFGNSSKKSERTRERCLPSKDSAEQRGRYGRKRHLSGGSTITVDEEGPTTAKRISPSKKQFPPRKTGRNEITSHRTTPRRFDSVSSSSSSTTSSPCGFNPKPSWTPTLGWCTDETVLARRSKQIEKAKQKDVYIQYARELPKSQRRKNDPKTPNKFINYSRRSWDSQVRIWKRDLYKWAGIEGCWSSDNSVNESFSGSECDSVKDLAEIDENVASTLVVKQEDIKIAFRPEADSMASLLGHFDLDSRTATVVMNEEDESTLNGPSRTTLGPRDFSQIF